MASDFPDVVEKVDEPSAANGDNAPSHAALSYAINSKETDDVLHSDVRN